MDKDEMMELERRRYIAAAHAGDRDWATQNNPSETLDRLARHVLKGQLSAALMLVHESILAAADAHVQIMDDLDRFDAPDIIAELKAAATDMQSLAESIRNVK